MEKSKKRNPLDIGLRSEEVQELMGKMPSNMVRFGIPVILCFVLVLLGASYFINCSIIETFPIEIVSEEISEDCKIPNHGNLMLINDQFPSEICAGQTIARVAKDNDTINIVSSISGKVFKRSFYRDGESVDSSIVICTIVPYGKIEYYGYIHVNYHTKKLLNYQTEIEVEYNSTLINGKVKRIAELPDQKTGLYTVEIFLGSFTHDSYEMVGNPNAIAKINLDSTTIFDKILKSLIKY